MSDTPAARRAAWTAPPAYIGRPDPGAVLWAEVYREGHRVGAVWQATDPLARPRCGILLAGDRDPDALLQDDLGAVTLAASARPLPEGWLEFLAERRDGQGGRLMVGPVLAASGLDAVRSLLGQGP